MSRCFLKLLWRFQLKKLKNSSSLRILLFFFHAPVDFHSEILEEVDFDFAQFYRDRLGPREIVRQPGVIANVYGELSADAVTCQDVVTQTLEVVEKTIEGSVVRIAKHRTNRIVCKKNRQKNGYWLVDFHSRIPVVTRRCHLSKCGLLPVYQFTLDNTLQECLEGRP